jgi:methylated-DNA-protein-cysteine methyltransferase-like protein
MINKKRLIYHLLSLIPSGKVMTYGQISRFLKVNSARAVGQILHQNKNPKIPCFKVVFADGSLSKNYGRGGIKKQKEFLEKDGVNFNQNGKVNLKKCFWRPTKVLGLYFPLLKKHGFP